MIDRTNIDSSTKIHFKDVRLNISDSADRNVIGVDLLKVIDIKTLDFNTGFYNFDINNDHIDSENNTLPFKYITEITTLSGNVNAF